MSNEHKDWIADNRQENKALCDKYPFLIPRNCFTGEIPEGYDYGYTELDAMPTGWHIAFGEQMCEEIAQALKKADYLDEYLILQIKEKYGELRWYDSGAPQEVEDIIEKYRRLSTKVCVKCGKPATLTTQGWISPYCDTCVPTWETSVPI